MFNPQRKTKIADIYMQQKAYRLHLKKMALIENNYQSPSSRYQDDDSQQKYLYQIDKSKKEVKERLSHNIKKQNNRLLSRLVQTDHRKQLNPQSSLSKKHFNSYFSSKRQNSRIRNQNYTLIVRMIHGSAQMPTLKQLKRQYKRSRKYAKNCRKLPAIVKNEQQIRKKLSLPKMDTFSTRNQQTRQLL